MKPILPRRRFIHIAATHAVGLCALPSLLRGAKQGASLDSVNWNGIVLGAEGGMRLYHPDKDVSEKLIQTCFQEIQRLEGIFSLYDSHSALSVLNREGRLQQAPPELVAVIEQAIHFSAKLEGAFDITVHPLCQLYAEHFATAENDSKGPDEAAIAQVLQWVDYRKITCERAVISLASPEMRITLNGIAQGYITDRITTILGDAGLPHALVELGEKRALHNHPEGRPWVLGIEDPKARGELWTTVDLDNRALATSGGYGTRYDAAGKHHHLLDPRSGRSAQHYASVSVTAPEAMLADALSTGLSVLSPHSAARVQQQFPECEFIFVPLERA